MRRRGKKNVARYKHTFPCCPAAGFCFDDVSLRLSFSDVNGRRKEDGNRRHFLGFFPLAGECNPITITTCMPMIAVTPACGCMNSSNNENVFLIIALQAAAASETEAEAEVETAETPRPPRFSSRRPPRPEQRSQPHPQPQQP